MTFPRRGACKIFAAGRLWPVGASALALGLAACSSVDLTSFRLPAVGDLRLPTMNAPVPVEERKPVPPEELVDSEGRCAGSPMAAAEATPASPGSDPVTTPTNPALAVGGVALGMTECDVVKRAGPPEKVVIGTNERAERTVTLTYTGNMRPGIYTFTGGRLVTIERAPEPPAPPRPTRPTRPAKPKPKPTPS